ncbi:WD40 repeat domain-containing protein [Neptunicella marina]|uniref:PQQ-binding-like beta-propeller repeat protein n=1 Tax=Neptunicella marina TaxID=2125989 RepID=A0A8J6M1Y4_9ALTE|nr:PQQ-binding-like beta-propeller repeat protein [Neptunicella marina]MBC3765938.1 PQQ-binding-like beta-propeller repeat protein [Neptunicella marina]
MLQFLRLGLILLLTGCSFLESKPLSRDLHSPGGSLAAAISSDGSVSVVSGASQDVSVWDLSTGKKRFHWRHQGGATNLVVSLDISYDNSYVVTSDREAFGLWNLQTGEPEGLWRIDESSIRDIAVADNGRGILVGRGNGKVMFFEPQTGRRLEFLGHSEKINSVALSPNGHYALTGSNDYVAYLWDTRTGQVIYSFTHPSRVTKVALDPEGRYAFTADSQKLARIWDIKTGKEISNLHYFERQKIFSSARFSKDGRYLLTGSPARRIDLWQVSSGKNLQEWRVAPKEGPAPQSAVVYAVGFLADNNVISESSSGLAEVWPLENHLNE